MKILEDYNILIFKNFVDLDIIDYFYGTLMYNENAVVFNELNSAEESLRFP